MPMLNEEQIQGVEQLAGLMYTPKQVAIMLQLDAEFVRECKEEGSIPFNAYWKGYYEAEKEFREEVKKLSNLGSSPAQTLFAKLIDQHKLDQIG